MNLKDALIAAAPAVGDGKIVPVHAFAKVHQGKLHVTDGNHFAEMPVEGINVGGSFIVRYEALLKALSRDNARLTVARDSVTVQAGRSRVKLKSVEDEMPWINAAEGDVRQLPEDFHETMKAMVRFIGDSDGQIWTQGVHLLNERLFVGNGYRAIQCAWPVVLDEAIPLPRWAAEFIAAQSVSPTLMIMSENVITFEWPSLMRLHTTVLSQNAPDGVNALMSQMSAQGTAEVPEGLAEALQHVQEHGGMVAKVGGGAVRYDAEHFQVEEEIEYSRRAKSWNVGNLRLALEYATHINLNSTHAIWKGEKYSGMVGGMS